MNQYTQAVNWLLQVYRTVIVEAGQKAPAASALTNDALKILQQNPYYEGEDLTLQ